MKSRLITVLVFVTFLFSSMGLLYYGANIINTRAEGSSQQFKLDALDNVYWDVNNPPTGEDIIIPEIKIVEKVIFNKGENIFGSSKMIIDKDLNGAFSFKFDIDMTDKTIGGNRISIICIGGGQHDFVDTNFNSSNIYIGVNNSGFAILDQTGSTFNVNVSDEGWRSQWSTECWKQIREIKWLTEGPYSVEITINEEGNLYFFSAGLGLTVDLHNSDFSLTNGYISMMNCDSEFTLTNLTIDTAELSNKEIITDGKLEFTSSCMNGTGEAKLMEKYYYDGNPMLYSNFIISDEGLEPGEKIFEWNFIITTNGSQQASFCYFYFGIGNNLQASSSSIFFNSIGFDGNNQVCSYLYGYEGKQTKVNLVATKGSQSGTATITITYFDPSGDCDSHIFTKENMNVNGRLGISSGYVSGYTNESYYTKISVYSGKSFFVGNAFCAHHLVKTDAVAATCETAGNSEYYTCSICGKHYSDIDALNEIESGSWVIPAHHDYDEGVIVPPTKNSDGYTRYTCSVCGHYYDGDIVPKLSESENVANIYGTSLSVEDLIGLNVYANKLTVNQKLFMVKITSNGEENVEYRDIKSGYYRFTLYVPAQDFNKKIDFYFATTDNEGNNIEVSKNYSYSINDYANQVIQTATLTEEVRNLVKTMSDFGNLAKAYFENDNSVDNSCIKNISNETLNSFNFSVSGESDTLININGITLVLDSEITTRLYFEINDESVANFNYAVDGVNVTPSSKTIEGVKYYYIEKSHIKAGSLGTSFTFSVGNRTITCSALSYAKISVNNGADPLLVNALKALYLYNNACNNCFN